LWTSFFAERFRHVIAVEASQKFHKALEARRSLHPNIQIVQQDVRSFEPQTPISLAFSGGLLMYLNDVDIRSLLKRLREDLKPDGIMVCRESTIRDGATIRQGDYQAVYRSIPVYKKIFEETGFQVLKIEKNFPYVLLEMGNQFLDKLKETIPYPKQWISILGPCVYFSLRLLNRWIVNMPQWLGMEYPKLENHFFAIRPS
jgi:trans-aconitate methyltransferase